MAVAPAILSLLGILQWKALPFPRAERIVQVNVGTEVVPVLETSDRFAAVSEFEAGWLVVEGPRGAFSVVGAAVSPGFFEVFGTRPSSGRLFASGNDSAGEGVVITASLCRRLFGGDLPQSAVVRAGDREVAVQGVVPDQPVFPGTAELWLLHTAGLRPSSELVPAGVAKAGAVARLAEGTTLQAARATVIQAADEFEKREKIMQGDVEVVTLAELLRRRSGGERGILAVSLCGLLAFVLLAYSGALAGFLAARQREAAVRIALGARRFDLARLLFLQLALLALPGLLAGVPLSLLVLGKLSLLVPPALAHLLPPRLDGESLAFALAGWAGAALVSGTGAWLTAPRFGLFSALVAERAEARRVRPQARVRLAFVCLALGIAVALGGLTAALRQSMSNLQRQPLGFEPKHAVSMVARFTPALAPAEVPARLAQLEDRLTHVPGVTEVAFSDTIPFGSPAHHLEISTPDRPTFWMGRVQGIHGPYLRVMGMRLLAGRAFAPHEEASGAPVALLDERSARKIFRGLPPLGKTLDVGNQSVEVVGIVASTKAAALDEPDRPQVYLPLLLGGRSSPTALAVIARLGGPVQESSFHAAAVGASLSQYQALADGVAGSLATQRLARDMTSLLWAVSLTLVALAIFGTFSWLLMISSYELALRLALGDTRAGIARRVLLSALRLLLAAVLLGILIYIPAGQMLRSLFFGVELLRPFALVETIAVVAFIALGAASLAAGAGLRRLSFDALKDPGNL